MTVKRKDQLNERVVVPSGVIEPRGGRKSRRKTKELYAAEAKS